MKQSLQQIHIKGACEHNLKNLELSIKRNQITVITGVSGSGKSSLAFDTILAESQRRFFYTLSQYTRQFLDLGSRPAVRSITGLSPAISLRQNETQPSKRASVGTLTDLAELLGVLFSNFGSRLCPEHMLLTTRKSSEEISKSIIHQAIEKTIAICLPLAKEKKGSFEKSLSGYATKGYVRAYIDGELVSLVPTPKLNKNEKHTIKIIIDLIKVKDSSYPRVHRAIDAVTTQADGYGEYFIVKNKNELDIQSGQVFSSQGGCPECGFSWPKLDPRYFSANSIGKCEFCQGIGYLNEEENVEVISDTLCLECCGTGLSSQYTAIHLGGKDHQSIHKLSLAELHDFVSGLTDIDPLKKNVAFLRVQEEILQKISRLVAVELGYLQIARRIHTLSGGEAQRVRLANILSDSLRGVLYILDEPSQGLHPSEVEKIWKALLILKEKGNTVILVDHDEYFIRNADWIVDLGPGGGAEGGCIMAQFPPSEAKKFAMKSLTAKHLISNEQKKVKKSKVTPFDALTVVGANLNYLNIDRVSFVFRSLNVVTGVSGAGKSSLVLNTLYPNLKTQLGLKNKRSRNNWSHCERIEGFNDLTSIAVIDRRPIAKSSVSMPVTYLDVFTDIRRLYEKLPDSQLSGLSAKSFSLFSEGGRCEECKGKGEVTLSMKFLSDARVRCPICFGGRYKEEVNLVKYNGLSISSVLDLTVDQALDHFRHHKRISKRLESVVALGLGYLKLGQTSASLSGGEAQRLKLAPFLSKNWEPGSILVIDEPTQGLHFEDVERLVMVFKKMVDSGLTIIIIEHNPEVICAADWVIDLGPLSCADGGKLVYQGPVEGLMKVKNSPTGKFLASRLA